MSNDIKYEQTSQGWDEASDGYEMMMSKTGFTAMYAADAFNCVTEHLTPNQLSGVNIIDIAAGTGALSVLAAKKVSPHNGTVLATDFSPKMIEKLNNAIAKESLTNIKTKVMDGQNLQELQDNTFDFGFSIFGLIFFPDQRKGLKELRRVLKPGGKVAISSWSLQTPTAAITARTIKRLMGDNMPPPTSPSSNPVTSLFTPEALTKLFEDCGFKNVQVKSFTHSMHTSIDDFILFSKGNPVHISLKKIMPVDKQALFDDTLKEELRAFYQSENIALESMAYVAFGEK